MSNIGKVFVGQATQNMDSSPDWGSYTKVILNKSDDEGYEVGDDTGLTLEADCPYATEAVAQSILNKLQGFSYKPYSATKAYVTPATELGDGMTSDGFYSGVYSIARKFSRVCAMNLSAPGDSETAHEFQYVSETDKKFIRQARDLKAQFEILSDRIAAKVSEVGGNNLSFGWELKSDGMKWYANGSEVVRFDSTGVTISGTAVARTVITGDLQVGGQGNDITASSLFDQATWSGTSYAGTTYGSYSIDGAGFGFEFDLASLWGSTNYRDYFYVKNATVTNGLGVGGSFTCGSATIGGYSVGVKAFGNLSSSDQVLVGTYS